MTTLLEEIVSGSLDVLHNKNCACKHCCNAKSGHKYWRERRKERYNPVINKTQPVAPANEYEQDQYLGSVFRAVKRNVFPGASTNNSSKTGASKLSSYADPVPKSRVVSIGEKQRAALIKEWAAKRDRAVNPFVKERYRQYINVIRKRLRPSWHQSEKDLQLFFKKLGMPGQRTFLNNQQAFWVKNAQGRMVPPKGSVVPDINPADAMIEVKNYNIQNKDALIRALQKQIARRMQQGPKDGSGNPLDQKIVLDMRGQRASWQQLNQLAQDVANATGLAGDNVQVVTWELEF